MKISKEKSEAGLNIFLEENDSCLSMVYGGNGDLYWCIRSRNRTMEDDSKKDMFVITKENYALYSLFEELYNDIKEINIFEDFEDNKDIYRLYNHSNYYELFDDDNSTITWYSDETSNEVANYLEIKKEKDCFVITFYIQDYIDGYDADFNSLSYIPVRFRNSGSRYYPFNIVFMKMYQKLKDVDDVNEYGHQIHFEEYLYERDTPKLLKKHL